MNIFVTGTDTGIGKTLVTAGLATVMQSLGYKTGVYKPYQTGAVPQGGFYVSPDINFVRKVDFYVDTLCTYLMKTPAAPLIAAEIDGVDINNQTILKDFHTIRQRCETLIVEGCGGLMVPVTPDKTMAHTVLNMNIPIIIVARPNLGTVNHTLLTIQYAQTMGLQIAGVIINRYPEGTNDIAIKTAPRLIEEYSDAKVLGIIPELRNFNNLRPGELIDVFINNADLEKIFDVEIPKLSFS